MKSIVEEASSVVKAIEKGWVQAGKPTEFSVKVFELEQKNFLGMTTKSAKIAIFFGDKLVHEKTITPRQEFSERRQPQQVQQTQQAQLKKEFKPVKKQQPHEQAVAKPAPQAKPEEKREPREQQARETWTDEMVKATQSWMQETLRLMNLSNKSFTIDVKNYYLKINFDKPLFESPERERLLFRSFAHLIMQSLRNKFKKGFRGFKVILNSEKAV